MDRDTFFFNELSGMSEPDLLDVQAAYWLAKESHRTQNPRDDGDRYFEHPRQVACILIRAGYRDKWSVIRGLLHDTIEDTTLPKVIIVRQFGEAMWHSLAILSKEIPEFHPQTGQIVSRIKKPIAEYWRCIADAPPLERAVKLADRLHNQETIGAQTPERQLRKCSETREFVLPIAKNTDWWFARELERQVVEIETKLRVA